MSIALPLGCRGVEHLLDALPQLAQFFASATTVMKWSGQIWGVAGNAALGQHTVQVVVYVAGS
jgi:hypothetical protein